MPALAADLLEDSGYEPIEDYAAIGDCRSVALVSRRGSIDWLCLPEFSAPSVFAALLDGERGGRFVVRPRRIVDTRRQYLGDSNVLQTTFRCAGGVLRLTDAMTVPGERAAPQELRPMHELLRVAECVDGEVALDVLYQIRPGYGRHTPRLVHRGALGWRCAEGSLTAYVYGDLELAPDDAACSTLAGNANLKRGERCRLVFSYSENDIAALAPLAEVDRRVQRTQQWWQAWAARCTYRGPYRAPVIRSCLALKLLTHDLSTAAIALEQAGPGGAGRAA